MDVGIQSQGGLIMRWVQVSGPPIKLCCMRCGRIVLTWVDHAWADLDGKPFKAYACEQCAALMGASAWREPPRQHVAHTKAGREWMGL